MLKKVFLSIFVLVGIWVIYMAHQINFEPREVNFFGKKINVVDKFPNFYGKYFIQKNEHPIFVRKNDIFSWYQNYCFQNKLNCIVFPNQEFYADIIWLSSIQYVWSVLDSSKTTYLYDMIDNITNLNPYWSYPYVFGQLLVPISKTNTEKNSEEKITSRKKVVMLWEKGSKYLCDKNKINKISSLSTGDFYRTLNEKWNLYNELKNPCSNVDMANYLAFNYFYYAWDRINSANFYKIAAFQEEAPLINSSMVAVVSGRWGAHITSMQIWFTQFLSLMEKLDKSKTDEESEIYKSKIDESFKKSLFEYQLDMLQRVDNQQQCLHNYFCLLQKGRLKQILFEDMQKCQSFKKEDLSFDKISQTVSDKDTDFTDKIKCILIAYGIENNFFNLESWDFVYPLNWEIPEQKFVYWRDYELQDWWIK